MNLPLEIPLFLLLVPLGWLAVGKLVRQKTWLGFSSAALLKDLGLRLSPLALQQLFLAIFVVTASIILARPTQQVKSSVPVYQEARDISLVLDTSGSMVNEPIKTAASVIAKFVDQRPQDRIALFVFDTEAYLEWPLSLDHEPLIFRLTQADTGGGTRIASGMIAGLNHLHRFGQNPGAIIIVSDGGSEVTADEKGAIESALGQTKLYWIWIGEGEDEDEEAQQFALYVKNLGGEIYHSKIENLDAVFNQINQLETSPVQYEQRISTTYHFGYLPLAALISLFLAAVAQQIREV